MVRKASDAFRWEGIEVHPYKETGTHFKSITRQTLAPGEFDLPTELRYFEIQPGGHSTLERHDHSHLVIVIRGSGSVLTGETVTEIGLHDIVRIPPQTWHQFQSGQDSPLGFLCIVHEVRDRPHRPDESEAAALHAHSAIGSWVKL
jgi:quercetin dioxygenase-like cupin family protein